MARLPCFCFVIMLPATTLLWYRNPVQKIYFYGIVFYITLNSICFVQGKVYDLQKYKAFIEQVPCLTAFIDETLD
jgi:hypothetical protein